MATATLQQMIQDGELKVRFGDTLRIMRNQKGMGRAELARRLQVDDSLLSKWEGNIHVPGRHTVKDIADILDVPIEVFPNRKGLPFSPWTVQSTQPSPSVVSLSSFRRRHSPSTKP